MVRVGRPDLAGVVAAGLGVASLVVSAAAVADPAPRLAGRRPNIVLVVTDDQGYGDFSVNGNPVLRTPNLDRLGLEGVRFSDFHVSPTCAPTRSALLSGRHEFRNGVTHTIFERERMSLDTVTLAEVLRSAGYATGIFGKWHLGDEDAYQPERRGFDEAFVHGGGGIGQTYPGSCGDAPGNTYFDPVVRHNGRFVKTSGYCTDVFTAQALRWMENVKGRGPFFAYVPYNAAHEPLQVRPEDEARYRGRVESEKAARFLGMVANIDDNVGRILARLQDWGIDGTTLVVVMNDNGGTFGIEVFDAGLRGRKGSAWEGGTRAASFWRWPGAIRPGVRDALTAHLDVFRTLATIAGARLSPAVEAQVEGRDLVPLLEDPRSPWPDRVLVTHLGRWPRGSEPQKWGTCSLRDSRYSLVRVGDAWQLFDLRDDPGQAKDVAARHPDVVARLAAAYDRWWDEVRPRLVNENARGPAVNPFKEAYWKQFEGPGPNGVPPGVFKSDLER
jgi:arylsulfatase A-like enzyme